MTAAWAHLLNAKHIDFVLAHVAAHPEEWDAAGHAASGVTAAADKGAAWSAAWEAAWDAARGTAWKAAWEAAWDAARDAHAARDACAALVTYDDCTHFLSYPPKQLIATYRLTNDPAALLLLPASFVFQGKYHDH